MRGSKLNHVGTGPQMTKYAQGLVCDGYAISPLCPSASGVILKDMGKISCVIPDQNTIKPELFA